MLSSATLNGKAADRVWSPWLEPLLLVLAAGLLYAINLDRLPPNPDELHHVIAAHGLLAEGRPAIAEGIYTRGLLHTWLVAGSYALFGHESLAIARVPSLVCMALLAGLLFVWLRREAGSLAAWLGAGLFAVSPFAVDIAQFARFYAPQCLAFFLAAILIQAAVLGGPGHRRRLLLGALALPPLLVAVHLQPTTLIGLAGIGVWAVGCFALPWLVSPDVPARRRNAIVLGVLGTGLALLLALWLTGILGELWHRYRWTPLFNQKEQGEFWYYHGWFSLLYPTFWPLTGLLGLLAVAHRPRPAAFALVTFAMAFLLNSLAAAKSLRYIVYAQPFLFAVWGIGLAALWPSLRAFTGGLAAGLGEHLARLGAPYRRLAGLLVGSGFLFLLLANPFWLRTVSFLADITVPPEQPSPDWPKVKATLEPWLAKADIVVTTEELATLYFLGRYDVRFSPSKLQELMADQYREFGIDFRTGRPVISTRESLERILACYPTGVILGPQATWNHPILIDAELARLIEAHAQPIPLPPRSHIFAYRWERPADAAPASACAGLPSFEQHKTAGSP
jgi:hypothetical protein